MKKVSIIKHNLMRATMTLAIMMTCAMAWADNDPVSYIDADGTTQTCTNYTVLTGNESSIGTSDQTKWYVVNSNISHYGKIECKGNVHLILCDGKTLTVNNSSSIGIYAYNLTIYGQSGQSGTLNATGSENGIWADTLTINGGIVSGTATKNYGETYGFRAGNITINGGKVTATGYYGITGNYITLGWMNYTDFIIANSYLAYRRVAIASGKAFIDEDGNTYSGTLSESQIQAIAGKTLYSYIMGSVPYLDENGQRQFCTEYYTLSGNESTLRDRGWYVVDGTLNYQQTITINASVHLILKDGAVMNVGTEQSPISSTGIQVNGQTHIYGQSTGENKGQLKFTPT
jgi:hypothetical protein